jgi:hypothetical protein
VLVLGERGQQLQPELEALINSELRDSNAQLSFERQAGRVRSWVERARRDDQTLLLAVVDTRQDKLWRVYIVDAERSRAAARTLPGGMEQDQAAVEAVASIVVSATAALREGLEVATKSVEEVVAPEEGDVELTAGPEPPREAPPPEAKAAPPPQRQPAVPPTPPESGEGYRFRLALLATAAAFAEPEPVSLGGRLSVGFSTPSHVVLRVGAGRHLPVTVASDLGRFDVDRSTGDLSLGYVFDLERLELEAEASLVAELLQRGAPRAADTATARKGRSYSRIGGLVGARARYRVAGPVALEVGVGAAYFPRPVRFVSGPETAEIAELWKFTPRIDLGAEVRLP